jgi:hypothetical protein
MEAVAQERATGAGREQWNVGKRGLRSALPPCESVDTSMDNISSCTSESLEFGPLAALSIQHAQPGVIPEAPTNEDRARAFRNAQPVALANSFEWPFQRAVGGSQAVARLMAASEAKPGAAESQEKAGVLWLATARAARLRRRTLPA